MSTSSALQPVFVGDLRLDVSSWEGNWKIRDADVSTSATTGTRYAMVRPDPEATIRLPLDSVNAIELVGLTLGAVIPALWFSTGGGYYDKLENALVTSVPKTVNTENDVPRVVVTVKGGDLTLDVQGD